MGRDPNGGRSRVGFVGAAALVGLCAMMTGGLAQAAEPVDSALQEQGDGLMKNVEEMVAHGGMGDANAIVHHCREAARYADMLIERLPLSDPRRGLALPSLTAVRQQCDRVAEIGVHADPGRLLNPAIKARAAARESIQSLGLRRGN